MLVEKPAVLNKVVRKQNPKIHQVPEKLTLAEIELFKQLPVLTLEQISRILQKPIAKVYEMSRRRAKRPLPTFKSGQNQCSTYEKIQQWIDAGFGGVAA